MKFKPAGFWLDSLAFWLIRARPQGALVLYDDDAMKSSQNNLKHIDALGSCCVDGQDAVLFDGLDIGVSLECLENVLRESAYISYRSVSANPL